MPGRTPRQEWVITSAGLLTCGSRRDPGLPEGVPPVACAGHARRLQLRGQLRNCPASEPRAPHSLFTGCYHPDRDVAGVFGVTREIKRDCDGVADYRDRCGMGAAWETMGRIGRRPWECVGRTVNPPGSRRIKTRFAVDSRGFWAGLRLYQRILRPEGRAFPKKVGIHGLVSVRQRKHHI